MGWVIMIGLVCLVVLAVVGGMQQAKMQADQDSAFASSHEGWDFFISPYSRTVLALNRQASQIALGPVQESKQYSVSAISQVEVLKDGASITSMNRGSQLAGAAVGAIALGGVGLLLGGLTGSKKNRATVHNIALKIIIDDRASPVHVVEFFKSLEKNGTDAQNTLVKNALGRVDHYHALLVNALRAESALGPKQIASTADQIAKLWELKQAGALTDHEFEAQKASLLSQPGGSALA